MIEQTLRSACRTAHTHVVEPLLEVRDAKVQQKKALYVIYIFYSAFALT